MGGSTSKGGSTSVAAVAAVAKAATSAAKGGGRALPQRSLPRMNESASSMKRPNLFTYGDEDPLIGAKPTEESNKEGVVYKPFDPRSAKVQEDVAAMESTTEISTIAVRRLMPSGPTNSIDSLLHEKNEKTLYFMEQAPKIAGEIRSRKDDGPGAKSFALWEAMQLNPRLVDTPRALSQSSTAIAALRSLQITGALPSDPVNEQEKKESLQQIVTSSPTTFLESKKSEEEFSEIEPRNALVTMSAEQADALVPAGSILDEMLLAHDPTKMKNEKGELIERKLEPWGLRPAETSPFDQLILRNPEDEELSLHRNEVFELFARHKSDPEYWTPSRLGEYYATRPEWIEVLLEFISPPIYAQVDGTAYGVLAVRSEDEFLKRVVQLKDNNTKM